MCGTANPSTIALTDALESGVETRVSKKLVLYSYYTQIYKTRYSRMKEMIISQSERVDDVESWILEQNGTNRTCRRNEVPKQRDHRLRFVVLISTLNLGSSSLGGFYKEPVLPDLFLEMDQVFSQTDISIFRPAFQTPLTHEGAALISHIHQQSSTGRQLTLTLRLRLRSYFL